VPGRAFHELAGIPAITASIELGDEALSKFTMTLRDALMVTVQDKLVPAHSPLHPLKTKPGAAAATSVTDVFAAYETLQSAPQLMPAGMDVTSPAPDLATLSTLLLVEVGGHTTTSVDVAGTGVATAGIVVAVVLEVSAAEATEAGIVKAPEDGAV